MPAFNLRSLSLASQFQEAACVLPPKDIIYPFAEDHFVEKYQLNIEQYSLSSWQRQVADRKKEDKRTIRSGDTIVADINYWLENIGIVRHDYQIYFHQKILESCLPKIYEHEWATYESENLNKFNMSGWMYTPLLWMDVTKRTRRIEQVH